MYIGQESAWSDFAARHWVVGGIVAALLWFVAGSQSLSNKSTDTAILWQWVSVFIIMIICVWCIAKKEWVGFIGGLQFFVLKSGGFSVVSTSGDSALPTD